MYGHHRSGRANAADDNCISGVQDPSEKDNSDLPYSFQDMLYQQMSTRRHDPALRDMILHQGTEQNDPRVIDLDVKLDLDVS